MLYMIVENFRGGDALPVWPQAWLLLGCDGA